MTDLTPINKLTPEGGTLLPASANWGKVYQNYISANLTSENLAKGAYDAYNLLSAGKLLEFQQTSFNTFNKLIDNQTSLATDLNSVETKLTKTISNLDKLFSTEQGTSISTGDIVSSTNKLAFAANDAGTASTFYDLSKGIKLPFATEGATPETSIPGLIKGFSAGRLDKIIPIFNTNIEASFVPKFFTTNYNLDDPQTATYRQPIELLVWQINYLQHQVAALQSTINAISGGEAPLGDIRVKSITFVGDGVPGTVVTPRYGLRYIKPGQLQTRG